MAATRPICHRLSGFLFSPPKESSPLLDAVGQAMPQAAQRLLPCLGPQCALYVSDPNGQGICGDTLQAAAIARIAEEVCGDHDDGDEDPSGDPPSKA